MFEPHKQKIVKVNAFVDVEIAEFVEALNLFPELQTFESCQGNGNESAWIGFFYGDWQDWKCLADFVLGFLGPNLMEKVGDAVDVVIRVKTSGYPQGELWVRPGAIKNTTQTIKRLVGEYNLNHQE